MFMRYTDLGIGHSVALRRIARDTLGTDSLAGTEVIGAVDEEDLDGGEDFREYEYQLEDYSDEDDDLECDDDVGEEDMDSEVMDGEDYSDEDEEVSF